MKKYLYIIGLLVLIGIFGISKTNANQLFSLITAQTATATTTVTYMTPGKATTTLVYDAYSNGTTALTDRSTLLLQFAASSSLSNIRTDIQYSQDNVDWYQDGGNINFTGYASTTKPFDISTVQQFNLIFASSTPGLGGTANKSTTTSATTTRAILIQTPTRYVRAIVTMPVGSADGAVWMQWVPSRQGK